MDDDSAIRQTFPPILELHGFDVRTAATVPQALAEITAHPFEVLIADLNIGQPGDGFTVVSAMRRTQPNCLTLILTGYPALETALQAIRSQVDDYVIKPAHMPELVQNIQLLLKQRSQRRVEPTKRLADILRDKSREIAARTVRQMQAHPLLGKLPLSEVERTCRVPVLIEALALELQSASPDRLPEEAMAAARVRGDRRHEQGYTVEMLLVDIRLFERILFDVVHENLFSINLSYLMLDLKRLNDCLGLQLQHTVLAYLAAGQRAA